MRQTRGTGVPAGRACSGCNLYKRKEFFYKANYGKSLNPLCKPCFSFRNRELRLKNLYGLTIQDYETMLDNQDRKCAICHVGFGTRQFDIDHNHTTGKVRGLLCNNCNQMLGQAKDSILVLERAIQYLEERDG